MQKHHEYTSLATRLFSRVRPALRPALDDLLSRQTRRRRHTRLGLELLEQRSLLSSTGDPTASPETLVAFAAALRAIATSPDFDAAGRHECPLLENHHWIVLLYRLADGTLTAGLGLVDEPYAGMLDRGVLLEYIENMVQTDLGSPRTSVNQAIRRAGGVQFAAPMRHSKVHP